MQDSNSSIFKIITIEHDAYRFGDTYRIKEREILNHYGYELLFANVTFQGSEFEDWWIHPDYFDKNLLTISATSLYYKECIELLKKFKNADYKCTHHCCKAFPDEYTYYLDTADVGPMLELFERIKLLNQGTL